MAAIDQAHVAAEIAGIRAELNSAAKGKRLETLIASIFKAVSGIFLEDTDIESDFGTEEIDLFFWNDRERDGLHFLDCPLIVECKGWSKPVSGRELRYFATLLKDKGRSSGVFIALEGVTGRAKDMTASFFHLASAMAAGQTVVVITSTDLETISSGEDLVAILRRRLTDQVRTQVMAIEGTTIKKQRKQSLAGT